jgi:hypothetical protein
MSNDDIIREFDRIFDAEQQQLSSILFQPKLYSNFSKIFLQAHFTAIKNKRWHG